MTKNENRINKLFKELVPETGKADSLAGELVRAMSRIAYRFYNDGDMVNIAYGKHNEVSDECRMVEGSRHPCCKDDVPDRRGAGRDTDARRHCGLEGGRQCSDRGRCCVPWYQPCWSAGTGERG